MFRSSIKGNNITRCFKDNSKSCVNQDHLAIQWNDTLKSVTNLCNESEYCLKYCKKKPKKKTPHWLISLSFSYKLVQRKWVLCEILQKFFFKTHTDLFHYRIQIYFQQANLHFLWAGTSRPIIAWRHGVVYYLQSGKVKRKIG